MAHQLNNSLNWLLSHQRITAKSGQDRKYSSQRFINGSLESNDPVMP